jgi:hypothetical protein
MRAILTIAKWMIYVGAAGWAVTIYLMLRLPPPSDIRPELYREPVQTLKASSPPFSFAYKGNTVQVVPMADYYLWGLVVSHNDPSAWYMFDISHDDVSPNVNDVCVIWGSNVQQEAYQRVSFHNDDNFCVAKWRAGDALNEDQLSNNHLITDNPVLRERIRNVHIGDQVYIKGMLVNYTEPSKSWGGRFRNTSLTRTDRGDGACEIIYVQDIQVLRSYNYLWAVLHTLCLWACLGALVFRTLLLIAAPRATMR